ncbi:hypothetical protein C1H46_034761 [Malus baccata]|uniref:Uncharacterized protein n=1 Tax=Malus baccata TaxID=106549 RepID=A0A540KZN2_MALBA|nr:hypothetical protein C1H46_034761 [Malus baccata]
MNPKVTQREPLDLQAQPFFHVVVPDYVDLVRRLGFFKRPGEVVGFGDGEIVEIVLELMLGLLVFGDGDVGGEERTRLGVKKSTGRCGEVSNNDEDRENLTNSRITMICSRSSWVMMGLKVRVYQSASFRVQPRM